MGFQHSEKRNLRRFLFHAMTAPVLLLVLLSVCFLLLPATITASDGHAPGTETLAHEVVELYDHDKSNGLSQSEFSTMIRAQVRCCLDCSSQSFAGWRRPQPTPLIGTRLPGCRQSSCSRPFPCPPTATPPPSSPASASAPAPAPAPASTPAPAPAPPSRSSGRLSTWSTRTWATTTATPPSR